MSDVFTKEKRSLVMGRIRGRGNKDTEIALARLLRENGFTGWRRHRAVFGKPDFVFPKLRLAIFVDGCFWHCCPKHATEPTNNANFWKEKLARNRARDVLVTQTLRAKGWTVFRVWEHELARKERTQLLQKLRRIISTSLTTEVRRRHRKNF